MKRSKKLPFKAETIRQLTGQELHNAVGGYYAAGGTTRCWQGGDEGAQTTEMQPQYEQQQYQQR